MTIHEARTASGGPMTKIYARHELAVGSRSKARGVVTSKMKKIVDESKKDVELNPKKATDDRLSK
ncbi:hypothetical protein THAOC_00274, partial [Thalassiosira oceanica]